VDRSDATTSKELNAAGLRLLSARQSDFSEAKRTFEKAVQLDSSNIEALNNLGYVYSRIGDYRSAEATLLKVLAVAPTRRAAHGNLGYVEAKLGKTQEAVKHYCQYMQQFDSLERGKSALVRANAADPDPNVQAAIEATVANCTR
jgi:Flp pilus assembly protein TadD